MRVVVTGAVGGLGRTLIEALTAADVRVVGIDRPNAVDDVAFPLVLAADLTDEQSTSRAFEEANHHLGGIDAVIGAAGIVDTVHRAAGFPTAAFRNDLEANLTSQFLVARSAYPYLKQATSSAIVFISSLAAQDGLPGQVSYSAAKAGVIGLTRALAGEWVQDGIRVNSVAPGLFATPKVVALPDSTRDRMIADVPAGRIATIGEVAGPALFLLSPAAGYMTGETLRVGGGAGLARSGLFR
jgi:NAD(P)-dependent dehydrogenase (short-subunit alcohol dehydrogenase family)